MSNDSLELEGGCYCGAVRYRFHGKSQAAYFCHCEQCRKITGTAHASNMQVKPSDVQWLCGENSVSTFDCPSERYFSNAFCSKCGSGLPFLSKSRQWMFVPIGSLDNAPDDLISMNIFWDDRANWYDDGLTQKKCPGFPDEE
ncbi:MAG: aldehyde-activating protein [Alteromonadaceae bacterium]|nr:aldehyde-activating protein [Alteromonadaceae bacterium]